MSSIAGPQHGTVHPASKDRACAAGYGGAMPRSARLQIRGQPRMRGAFRLGALSARVLGASCPTPTGCLRPKRLRSVLRPQHRSRSQAGRRTVRHPTADVPQHLRQYWSGSIGRPAPGQDRRPHRRTGLTDHPRGHRRLWPVEHPADELRRPDRRGPR